MPADERTPTADALREGSLGLLARSEVELRGRLPWSSNATFLATLSYEGATMAAVYKPGRGERPLWDFPRGLFLRELAAYRFSEALGWGLVPETVVRSDGPLGPGSFQRFVEADFSQHYFTLLEQPEHHAALRTIALFDAAANNADRKSGHCLLDGDGRIWAIDNGLCFNEHPHLRTVIWDFAGEPVPPHLLADLERVTASPGPGLEELLEPGELAALSERVSALSRAKVLPDPGTSRRAYPWPLV
ncbi:MAG TPA: SCO1664 family protein [Acidimicrobiales bacterium]|nr:SCO1664 family protein [Acidimicrobiales bacterium]